MKSETGNAKKQDGLLRDDVIAIIMLLCINNIIWLLYFVQELFLYKIE